MKFGELVEWCIRMIENFDPKKAVTAYVEETLKGLINPFESVFIKQVFFGVVRYRSFLKAFTEALFKLKSSSTNRGDATLYWVFAYLTIFRLDELSHNDYRRLIQSQDPVKMNVFLQFIFSTDNLKENVREQWVKEYDASYIDEKVIGAIQKSLSGVSDILASIEKKATGKVVLTANLSGTHSELTDTQDKLAGMKEKEKRVTVPKPFNITQQKPKKEQKEEEKIEPFKPKGVPESVRSTNMDKMRAEKEEKREKIKKQTKEKYAKGVQPFKFKTDDRPMNRDKLVKEKEEEEKKLLQFNKKYHEPPLNFKEIEAEVRLNAAAILREEHLLQKKAVEEEKKLKSYEVDLHNSGEFDRWQREMKEKDKIEKMQEMQKRKIEMRMARDEAVESCQQKLKENQVLVEKMKMESDHAMKEREDKREEDIQRKQVLRTEVIEAHEGAAVEKQRVLERNQQIREEVAKEIEEALQRRKEEELIEKKYRDEIIQKIREIDRRPIERTTGFDPTETAGHGLLEEMSLAELRERWELLKKEKTDDEERKRQENMKKKEDYTSMMLEKSDRITAAREQKAREQERVREEKKRRIEKQKRMEQEIRDKGLFEVHDKISSKKKDRKREEERLAKELKEIKLQRQYLNENKAKIEEKAWQRLEMGAERKTRVAQNQKLIDQYKVETVKMKEMQIKTQTAKTAVLQKVEKNQKYEEEYQEKIRENEALHKQDLLTKAKGYEKQKEFESNLKTKMVQKNPYSMKVTIQTRKTGMQGTIKREEPQLSPETAAGMEMGMEMEDDKIDDIERKLGEEHLEQSSTT